MQSPISNIQYPIPIPHPYPMLSAKTLLAHLNLPRLRPWRELAVQGMMVMGLSWAVPWFRSLTQSTYALSPAYTFVVLWAMLLAAYLSMRALSFMQFKVPLRRGVLAGLLAISVLAGLKTLLYTRETVTLNDLVGRPLQTFSDFTALIPDEFVIIVTVLLIWRWGVNLAHEHVEPHLVLRTFQIGILMLVAFVFINTFATGETPGRMAHLFVFAGLLAMGAARVDTLSTLRGGREHPFDRRWLAGLLLAVAGTVGLAAGVAAMLSGEDNAISVIPRLLVGGFLAAVVLVATPLFLAATYALFAAARALDPESPVANSLQELFQGLQGLLAGLSELFDKYLGFLEPVIVAFARLAPGIRTLVLWGIVLGLAAATVLVLFVQRRRRRAGMDEETQSILPGGLLALLRKSWQARFQEVARRLAQAADFRGRRRLLAAARIRRIYANLMELCEDLQHPRAEAQTPLEFLVTLERLFPSAQRELALITNAYLRIRYGEFPESRHEVQQVEQAWQYVRQQGERAKQRKTP